MFTKRTISTPIGALTLIGQNDIVEHIHFGTTGLPAIYGVDLKEDGESFTEAVNQLSEYFAGERQQFTFPLFLNAGGFQKRALEELRKVGYGSTLSYKELAERAGSAGASRAAGTACASNPLPIVYPCHRVLKSDGSLGGFGGGLDTKKKLLDLEHAVYKH